MGWAGPTVFGSVSPSYVVRCPPKTLTITRTALHRTTRHDSTRARAGIPCSGLKTGRCNSHSHYSHSSIRQYLRTNMATTHGTRVDCDECIASRCRRASQARRGVLAREQPSPGCVDAVKAELNTPKPNSAHHHLLTARVDAEATHAWPRRTHVARSDQPSCCPAATHGVWQLWAPNSNRSISSLHESAAQSGWSTDWRGLGGWTARPA